MNEYVNIILEDKIYSQRTPTSKIVEFTLDGVKQNTYNELPKEIKSIFDTIKLMQETPDDYFKYEIVDNKIQITDIITDAEYIKIPEYIKELPVTTIDKEVLKYNTHKTKQIILPNTIEQFSDFSFANAPNLKYINIPNKITEIPTYCFFNCGFKNIDLNNVTKIKSRAFQNCYNLKEIDLRNITSIYDKAFLSCSNLQEIKLPELEIIPASCFSNCIKLEKIELPKTIKRIGIYAFSDCTQLKNINFPIGLEIIEACAFLNCEEMKEFKSPETLLEIGSSAFRYTSVANIELNKNLKEIGPYAFQLMYGKDIENLTMYKTTKYHIDSFCVRKNFHVVKKDNDIER